MLCEQYLAGLHLDKYPPLFTSSLVNNWSGVLVYFSDTLVGSILLVQRGLNKGDRV